MGFGAPRRLRSDRARAESHGGTGVSADLHAVLDPRAQHRHPALLEQIAAAGQVDLLDGGEDRPSLTSGAPVIYVSSSPAELIVLKGEPQFAFGYGLSYTTFEYCNPRLSANKFKDVGVRYKGNGTFLSCRDGLKRALKLDFNQFAKVFPILPSEDAFYCQFLALEIR
jgi:hypothetical protein